jgi:hypothetical protein
VKDLWVRYRTKIIDLEEVVETEINLSNLGIETNSYTSAGFNNKSSEYYIINSAVIPGSPIVAINTQTK